MEKNDWLDDVLYRTIPSLDLAMLCRQETQVDREPQEFSAGSSSDSPGADGNRGAGREFQKGRTSFHWYDESQGADCYDYKSNQQMETDDVNWIYPSYMPSGYELAEENKKEQFGSLRLKYYDEAGSNISYNMWIFGSRAIYLDGEYDASETMEINNTSWFVTWRDKRYWMARAQKGDIFYLVSTPPELPREELIKILEGIIPADRDAGEVNLEVENYEEARKIYFGE